MNWNKKKEMVSDWNETNKWVIVSLSHDESQSLLSQLVLSDDNVIVDDWGLQWNPKDYLVLNWYQINYVILFWRQKRWWKAQVFARKMAYPWSHTTLYLKLEILIPFYAC